MICSPPITDIEIPYQLLHDIEDNSSDSNMVDHIYLDRNIEMNAFFFTWIWYIFFGFWCVLLIACIIYSIVSYYK